MKGSPPLQAGTTGAEKSGLSSGLVGRERAEFLRPFLGRLQVVLQVRQVGHGEFSHLGILLFFAADSNAATDLRWSRTIVSMYIRSKSASFASFSRA